VAVSMTIRVVLQGSAEVPLVHPAGRVLVASGASTFADLAEGIDMAFARWDLTPSHEFEVEGRLLRSADAPADDLLDPLEVADSAAVALGDVGLRPGAVFTYRFDPGEGWLHRCTVEAVEPSDEPPGEEPEVPTPVFGWGVIPDQYGRLGEDDDDADDRLDEDASDDELGLELLDDDESEAELAAWREVEAASWAVVAEALGDVVLRPAPGELAAAAHALREGRGLYTETLLAVGGFDAGPPTDDEELWLESAAGVIAPRDEPPLDVETVAAWATLEPADWAGAIIELVRAGPGQPADAETLLRLVARCPEVDSDDLDADDEALLAAGFGVVVQLWRELGALDERDRLTALGCWGLPESLRRAWTA
jgi:hypothetical protein